MVISQDEVGLLQSLLPGFFACAVLNAVVPRQNRAAILLVVEALAFALPIKFIADAILGLSECFVEGASETSILRVSSLLSVAIILPLLFGLSINHDFHMRILRYLGVTRRTARGQVWYDAFRKYSDRYVVVRLKDGSQLDGWPEYYSDFMEEGMLLLKDPYIVSAEGVRKPMNVDTVLLMREGIEAIQFKHLEENSGGLDHSTGSEAGRTHTRAGHDDGKRSGYNPPPPKRENPTPPTPPQPKK